MHTFRESGKEARISLGPLAPAEADGKVEDVEGVWLVEKPPAELLPLLEEAALLGTFVASGRGKSYGTSSKMRALSR